MSQSNVPMMPVSRGSESIFQIWIRALTKPSEFTFAEMVASPNAKASTAYLWVFVGSLVNILFVMLIQGLTLSSTMGQYFGDQSGGGFGVVIVLIVLTPVIAALSVLFFAIGAAIVQWIAGMFGGKGTVGQLTFALGAIAAPTAIISGVLSLFSAIPILGLCFGLVGFVFGLYIFVLQIIAVKGVNQFGWGAAIGSVLIPGVVVFIILACLMFLFAAMMAPIIGNVFSTIGPSFGP